MILLLGFRNLKRRIQYNRCKFEESLDFATNWYTGAVEVTDVGFRNLGLTIQQSTSINSEIHGFGVNIISLIVENIYLKLQVEGNI